jgi:2-aminoadipate transaminase
LRDIIARRLAQRGIQISGDNVLVTTGSVQGLHLIGRVLLDAGDTIVTEAPTFMGALAAWENQQPRFLSVPVDADGMRIDLLEEQIGQAVPKFVYLLPTFQNPSGVSLSLERRQRLLDLARQLDFWIVEDDAYGEFWFDGEHEPIPPLRSLPGAEDHVLYVGTFSKILAPGIRLAYTIAPPEMVRVLVRAKRGVDFHTDGLVQHGVVRLIQDPAFDFEQHVRSARREYARRRTAMLDGLEAVFTHGERWTRPAGGFFLWLDLPGNVSGEKLAAAAPEHGVAVLSGDLFYPNLDGGQNAVRLSYSNTPVERIEEGLRRLERAINTVTEAP